MPSAAPRARTALLRDAVRVHVVQMRPLYRSGNSSFPSTGGLCVKGGPQPRRGASGSLRVPLMRMRGVRWSTHLGAALDRVARESASLQAATVRTQSGLARALTNEKAYLLGKFGPRGSSVDIDYNGRFFMSRPPPQDPRPAG